MRNKFFFIPILVLSFGFSIASAQLSAPILKDGTNGDAAELYSVGDVKGTIKSTAVYIVKPVYPLEAQQAGAEGAVRVQITIDEEGNVVAAKAVEGHSLLRTICEETARRAKFRIARDTSGNAVKIEGFLTYNFTIQKAGWTRIAYGLSFFGKLPFSYFSISTTKKAFASEWTNERQMLEKLKELGKNESSPSPVFVRQSPTIAESTTKTPNGITQESANTENRLILPPTAEETALVHNLISALQSRLGDDELSLWQFKLGLDLSRAVELFRNPNERTTAVQIIKQAATNAPDTISAEFKVKLENLAMNFQKEKRTMDSDQEIVRLLASILNSK